MRACIDWATRLSESIWATSRCTDVECLDAGAVLEWAGQCAGEARAGLGVAARAVLDFGVGVAHDLLEDDVDEGASLVAGWLRWW